MLNNIGASVDFKDVFRSLSGFFLVKDCLGYPGESVFIQAMYHALVLDYKVIILSCTRRAQEYQKLLLKLGLNMSNLCKTENVVVLDCLNMVKSDTGNIWEADFKNIYHHVYQLGLCSAQPLCLMINDMSVSFTRAQIFAAASTQHCTSFNIVSIIYVLLL